MIRDNRPVRCILVSVLSSIAALCASRPGRTACAADLERFADVRTSEDEALRLIGRIRLTAPTKDEVAVWARVANSKKYSDVRRRRAVLQLLDRHAHPGMTLGDLARLLGGPSWLQYENVHNVKDIRDVVGDAPPTREHECVFLVMICLPDSDQSGVFLRFENWWMTEEPLYDALQGRKTRPIRNDSSPGGLQGETTTDPKNVKIAAIVVRADAAEDRALVTLGAREWPRSRPGRKEREIAFAKGDLNLYARQLDFFGIELGVLRENNTIVYASNFSKAKPDTRINTDPPSENRYFLWRKDEFQGANRELLRRAGIDAGDQLILKFLPPTTEAQLIDLETGYPGADLKKKLDKTRFGVRATGKGFSFYVLEQVQQ
jgi:hypothetical protein